MAEKKIYYGLDLLKFLMALMVVMIHVKPNTHSELLTAFFNPLMGLAVPTFFLISSYLIFSKLQGGGGVLLRWAKRLAILYGVWLIIDAWFVIFRREYFELGLGEGLFTFAKDLLFGHTYPGSWFLSALLVGVIVVYFTTKFLHPYIMCIISLIIAIYIRNIEILPDIWKVPYMWYAEHIREEVNLSFPSHLIWISIGQLFSISSHKINNAKAYLLPLSLVIFVLCFASFLWFKTPLSIYVFVIATFLIFFMVNLSYHPIYKRIREISILMFLFHFSIAGKMALFCSVVGDTLWTNYLYYFLVVGASVLFAEVILRLENRNGWGFLKYTH